MYMNVVIIYLCNYRYPILNRLFNPLVDNRSFNPTAKESYSKRYL